MFNGRLLFDVTKASKQKHHSGLSRVSDCLRRELFSLLDSRLVEVVWNDRKKSFVPRLKDRSFVIEERDVLLTGELFCEYERPGVEAFLKEESCQTYAIFHDAIPLQHPEYTWPHSVQRHPSYMKMLTLFKGVFAVSQYSSMVLEEYWEWLGYVYSPSVKSLQLGCDGVFSKQRTPSAKASKRIQILSLGIIEKRKGQDLILAACEELWKERLEFDLHIVGRTNPYFGKEIEKTIRKSIKEGSTAKLHGALDDPALQSLFEKTDLVLFGSRAEGCGLPVLESLWLGLPVLASNLKPVRETSRFGGCRLFEMGNVASIAKELRRLIEEKDQLAELTDSIRQESLPRWSDTANEIIVHF